jgi:hypothetical protein
LHRSVVDKDVNLSKLMGGLTHKFGRIRTTEIAAEDCYFTAFMFRLYFGGHVSERCLIARNE